MLRLYRERMHLEQINKEKKEKLESYKKVLFLMYIIFV